jgi:nicotinamide-nucleotide amidase
MKRISSLLINALKEKQLTIALAESVTCGLAMNKLSLVKGTAGIFKGGICCYDENVKCSLLKVSSSILKRYTAESQQTTDEMARKLGKLIPASVCVAITGLAGEGGSETKEKPVGTMFFSVYYKRKLYRHKQLFRGSPNQIQKKAVKELFKFILRVVA